MQNPTVLHSAAFITLAASLMMGKNGRESIAAPQPPPTATTSDALAATFIRVSEQVIRTSSATLEGPLHAPARIASRATDAVLDLVDPAALLPRIHDQPYKVLDVVPVPGKPTSSYGYRMHPIDRRLKFHKGMDFRGAKGTPVRAAASGKIRHAGRWGTYGNIVVIDHGDGVETRYAHLSRVKVSSGSSVEPGTIIGLVGSTGKSTGPHLHFEVRLDGDAKNPAHAFRGPAATAIHSQLHNH